MERIPETPGKIFVIAHMPYPSIGTDSGNEFRHLPGSRRLLDDNPGPDGSRAHSCRITKFMKVLLPLPPVAIRQSVGISPKKPRLPREFPDSLERFRPSRVPMLRLHRPRTAPTHRKGGEARDFSGAQAINVLVSLLLQIIESGPHHYCNESSIPVVGGNDQIIGGYP